MTKQDLILLSSQIPSRKAVAAKLEQACKAFLARDAKLFKAKAGERLLTGSLAHAIKRPFTGWDVDPEYNRYGYRPKRSIIKSRKASRDSRGHLVTPDIIVHKRLVPRGQNLLAIEAKHEGKKKGILKDREKLASYLRPPLSYHFVALVTFSRTQRAWCSFELYSRRENPEQSKNITTIELEYA